MAAFAAVFLAEWGKLIATPVRPIAFPAVPHVGPRVVVYRVVEVGPSPAASGSRRGCRSCRDAAPPPSRQWPPVTEVSLLHSRVAGRDLVKGLGICGEGGGGDGESGAVAPPPCSLWACGGPVQTCMGSMRFPLGHGVRRGGAGDATVRSGNERRLAALSGPKVGGGLWGGEEEGEEERKDATEKGARHADGQRVEYRPLG